MSLVIGMYTRDGFIFGCDTRTTIAKSENSNKSVRYDDTTVKIVPFPNRCCVAFAGDNMVDARMTVHEFLYFAREKFGKGLSIVELPSLLLQEFKQLNCKSDITLLIGGCVCKFGPGMLYRLRVKDGSIVLCFEAKSYGAMYEGVTSIAHAIMNFGVDYTNMTVVDGADLVDVALSATIGASCFSKEQSVGGEKLLYVISSYDDDRVGWCVDGRCVRDRIGGV